MNDNGYTTPRAKRFGNAHTHFIVKKKKMREFRITKFYESKLTDFQLRFVDKTILNEDPWNGKRPLKKFLKKILPDVFFISMKKIYRFFVKPNHASGVNYKSVTINEGIFLIFWISTKMKLKKY